MKRIIYLLIFVLGLQLPSLAQDDDGAGGKVRERMVEFMQEKLSLTRNEAERFTPVFIEYFKEERKINQENRGDRLVLASKIAELRLKYREQFKAIIGEKRSNDVFTLERDFIQKVKTERDLRLQNRQ